MSTNKDRFLHNPIEALNATDSEIEEAYSCARIKRDAVKNILQNRSKYGFLTTRETRCINRLLRDVISEETKAKRKELSARIIKNIISIGEDATHTANLGQAISVQSALTKDKVKMGNLTTTAIKRMNDIVTHSEDGFRDELMITINQLTETVNPRQTVEEQYSGYSNIDTPERDMLVEILANMMAEDSEKIADDILSSGQTKMVAMPRGLLPNLPEVPHDLLE
jgi:hypothetical protein